MTENRPEKERRFWNVDPEIFQRHTPSNPFAKFLRPLRTVGGFALWGMMFAYPFILISMGLVFGWIAFWGFFLLSVFVIGLAITNAGYARNFDASNASLSRQLVGLLLGFAFSASFYLGLFILKSWLLPLVVVLLVAGLAYKLAK